MPRRKKTVRVQQRPKGLGDSIQKLRMSESYASLILGFAVVVVIIFALFSFFGGRRQVTTSTSSTKTEQLPTEQIEETIQKTAGNNSVYIVGDGETLWSISEAKLGSGFNWHELAEANKISDPLSLKKGAQLVIPTATPTPQQTAVVPTIVSTTTLSPPPIQTQPQQNGSALDNYVIQPGDNLWDICVRKYGDGFRWAEIAKLNKLENPDLIFPANTLELPRS